MERRARPAGPLIAPRHGTPRARPRGRARGASRRAAEAPLELARTIASFLPPWLEQASLALLPPPQLIATSSLPHVGGQHHYHKQQQQPPAPQLSSSGSSLLLLHAPAASSAEGACMLVRLVLDAQVLHTSRAQTSLRPPSPRPSTRCGAPSRCAPRACRRSSAS